MWQEGADSALTSGAAGAACAAPAQAGASPPSPLAALTPDAPPPAWPGALQKRKACGPARVLHCVRDGMVA
jgi:hypothetical protein